MTKPNPLEDLEIDLDVEPVDKKAPWHKTKAFKIISIILGTASIILIVLFNQQIGNLLNSLFLKAARQLRTITISNFLVSPDSGLVYEDGKLKLAPPGPRTRVETHIAAYFTPTQNNLNFIASRFNAIIGSFPYGAYVADILQALNPDIITLGYRDVAIMHEINDTHGDWAEVNTHEDWFLHKVECTPNPDVCSPDNRILRGPDAYIMDVGNMGWRTHYITYVVTILNNPTYVNYDGVFADDVWATIPWHPDASIRARWPSDIVNMVTNIKNYLPVNKIVVTNSGLNYQVLDIAHGVMNEGFVHAPWSDDYTFRTVSEWQGDIEALIYGVTNNKIYMAQSGMIGDKATQDQKYQMMLFTLTSYLMGSGDGSTYSFKDYDEPGYDKVFFYPEWNVDLGEPIEKYGLMTAGDNIYKRKFSKGLVLVNPSNTAYTNVNLDKTYKTLSGQTIDHVDMPSHSGIILKNN